MNQIINPSILYFGTPVVLISTVNENNSFNIAPISSIFWNGYRCMIGIAAHSKTTENILRTRECVLNLPSENMANAVDRLALTYGTKHHIDPDKWKPLIMSFQKFYGLSGQIAHSKLATVPERLYPTPDTEEATAR